LAGIGLPTPIAEYRSAAAESAARSAHPPAADPGLAVFVRRLALPLFGNRLYSAPTLDLQRAVDLANAGMLDFLLHQADLEAMARPADERLAAALAPLRTKLDMLIDMVGRMSYRGVTLPPVCEIELGPTHIAWESRQLWRRGDWLRLELFFHPVFREPICLLAEVTVCSEQHCDGAGRTEGELAPMPPGTAESLGRLAYLTQRQQQSRHRSRSSTASEP
jgi:hypothetical protein